MPTNNMVTFMAMLRLHTLDYPIVALQYYLRFDCLPIHLIIACTLFYVVGLAHIEEFMIY